MVKILFLGNDWVAGEVFSFLHELHPDIYPWTIVGSKPPNVEWVYEHKFDIAVSVLYPHILSADFIAGFRMGVVNLHPSLLPYNRGKHPAFWAMADGLPAGVTLHYMDEGVDTGNIIAQKHVPYDPYTRCNQLYTACLEEGVKLFKQTWGSIVDGTNKSVPQPRHKATFHLSGDILKSGMVFNLNARDIHRIRNENEYENETD
jgi:methionyl-tRNA formyltransferase